MEALYFVALALALGPLALTKTKWFLCYLALFGVPIIAFWVFVFIDRHEDLDAGGSLALLMLIIPTITFVLGATVRSLMYAQAQYITITLAGLFGVAVIVATSSLIFELGATGAVATAVLLLLLLASAISLAIKAALTLLQNRPKP